MKTRLLILMKKNRVNRIEQVHARASNGNAIADSQPFQCARLKELEACPSLKKSLVERLTKKLASVIS